MAPVQISPFYRAEYLPDTGLLKLIFEREGLTDVPLTYHQPALIFDFLENTETDTLYGEVLDTALNRSISKMYTYSSTLQEEGFLLYVINTLDGTMYHGPTGSLIFTEGDWNAVVQFVRSLPAIHFPNPGRYTFVTCVKDPAEMIQLIDPAN